MSSRTSSRKSGAGPKKTGGGGAGDMPATQKSGSKAELSKGSSASSSMQDVLKDADRDDTPAQNCIPLSSRSRSSLGKVPPRSDSSLSQRVSTPTKHISLTAVRRKQEVETPIEPELDWREFTRSNSRLSLGGRSYSNTFRLTQSIDDETVDRPEDEHDEKTEMKASAVPSESATEMTTQMEAMNLKSGEQSQVKETKESSDDDDDDDDGSDSDDEPRKAPNELMMEFLDCVMKKDYKNAEKLCRMILIYEPNNQEALTFHPVLLEKLQLDLEAAEAGEEGSGDEDGDGDDDGDDDDDDDSEEDSSLENDSSDDDDDDDNNEEDEEDNIAANVNFLPDVDEDDDGELHRPDSGIGM